ncbi:MAG: GntR family transcriptional regulator [Deltaproteobacteria bacterium]|nr:MAG: GntR family transcriptional regulator [Deltaproteobacteria bacterium]
MELVQVDTQRAYEQIREKIITLELAPGALIDEQHLAEELDIGTTPIREALKLLFHDDLVVVTPRHGLYVADISIPDLEQLSEMRLSLESLCARLAAQRAGADDLTVLEALRQEQASIPPEDSRRLLDIDHKFHQALVKAAKNKYLTRTLEHFFGLSQRLWYMALPQLDFLPTAVAEHLDLVEAIKNGDADRAEQIMHNHVQGFYARVKEVLQAKT